LNKIKELSVAQNISRRNFLKTTSAAAAIGATSMGTVSKVFASPRAKSRVVIAKDTACLSGSTPVTAKIQDMVDYSIMTLAGLTDKGKAYESLFPAPLTTTTKILLKRNDISGASSKSNSTVVNCLKTGLTSMLNGTFPAANITILNSATGTASTTTITCGGKSFKLKKAIMDATYVINCPVCWAHGTAYSVTMSMKNTMNFIDDPNNFHDLDSSGKSWLWECSNSTPVKARQVFSLMDAIMGNHVNGPGGSSTFTAHTIIVSKDIVAVDYNAVKIMEEKGMTSSRLTTARNQLSSAAQANLGTNDPNNMEIINIGPPWGTGIINDSGELLGKLNIQILHNSNRIDFILPKELKSGVDVAIFDMSGKGIWAAQNVSGSKLTWNCRDMHGNRIVSGMYVYKIKVARKTIEGFVSIMH